MSKKQKEQQKKKEAGIAQKRPVSRLVIGRNARRRD